MNKLAEILRKNRTSMLLSLEKKKKENKDDYKSNDWELQRNLKKSRFICEDPRSTSMEFFVVENRFARTKLILAGNLCLYAGNWVV